MMAIALIEGGFKSDLQAGGCLHALKSPVRVDRGSDIPYHKKQVYQCHLKVFYVHNPNTYNAENSIEAPD
jgi:hypothetical protein